VSSSEKPSILATMRLWFEENMARDGFGTTLRNTFRELWEFLRESTPAQRRSRYGDVEYDWDYRVDTTSATVNWRERLLGHFHSPYQPTEPALFKEMMTSLETDCPEIDFQDFTFIDAGSGKGRVLLMASDYPFRRILGVELLPDLNRVAVENIGAYKGDLQRCFAIETVQGDARKFVFPPEPIVLYLFNPLTEPGLSELISNLERSLKENPRIVYMLYHNPLLQRLLAGSSALRRIGGTHQYSVYTNSVYTNAV
jgi:SAM-dependent methyltransferase